MRGPAVLITSCNAALACGAQQAVRHTHDAVTAVSDEFACHAQDPDNLLTGEAQGYAAAQIFFDVFKVRLSCSSVLIKNCLSRLSGE